MRVARLGVLTGTALAIVFAATNGANASADELIRSIAPVKPARAAPAAQTPRKPQSQTATPHSPAAVIEDRRPALNVSIPPGPLDSPSAEKIRELLANKQFDRMLPRRSDRDSIIVFYKARDFAPLWVIDGAPSQTARAAIAYLRTVEADGLDPNDYPAPNLTNTSPDAQAEAEVRFTATLLSYARHALSGRVHFSRISPTIDYKDRFDAVDVLKELADSRDIARTLDSFEPQHNAYKALKAKLADFRRTRADTGPAPIPGGPVLRYSKDKKGKEVLMSDPRVPALRERLGVAAQDDTNYDRTLAETVAKFQKSRDIKSDGVLAAATIDAINGPTHESKLTAILSTMERWRWAPHELGKAHVIMNIPDYHIRVYNEGAQIWMTRVVVGKPSQATPLLTETMKFITVNPTWNVPQSIVYQELLPIYETSDRAIFDKMGLKMTKEPNGRIRVYQPPGDKNALGRIRFNFPNKFLVYQHDTPEKNYFSMERRAYSHGCQRVQDPVKYAEVMLSLGAPGRGYTQESIRKMIGGNEEKQLDFQTPIPIHLTYQTAFVDDSGILQFRDDIYGIDAKMQAVLKSSERLVADAGIERPADPNFQPSPQHVERMQSAARTGSTPFTLFNELFR